MMNYVHHPTKQKKKKKIYIYTCTYKYNTFPPRLHQGLRGYAEYVMERARLDDLMAVNDPRSEEEKILAADLLSSAMSQRPEPIEPGKSLVNISFCACMNCGNSDRV